MGGFPGKRHCTVKSQNGKLKQIKITCRGVKSVFNDLKYFQLLHTF